MEPSLSGAAKRSSEAAPAASEQPPEPTPGPLPGPPPLPDCLQEAALVHLVERGAALTGVATQAVGAALVLVATTGISYIVWAYFRMVILSWFGLFSVGWWATTAVGVYLLVMILFYYFGCIFTHPGHAPAAPSADLKLRAHALAPPPLVGPDHPDALNPRAGGEFAHEDRRSGLWKPARAHHDHVTDAIVLRFDHYCPWMWNAIGHFNYRYFIGFLLAMHAGCIFAAALAWPLFRRSPGAMDHLPGTGWRVHASMAFVLPASIAVVTALFAGWHVFLAGTNQTTIEFFHNLSRNSRARELGFPSANFYDLGWTDNLSQVFGSHPFWMQVLPVRLSAPGNGLEWPTRLRRSIRYSTQLQDGSWDVPQDFGVVTGAAAASAGGESALPGPSHSNGARRRGGVQHGVVPV